MNYKGSIKKRLTKIIMLVTIITGVIGYGSFIYWYMANQYKEKLNLSESIALVLGQDVAKLILLNNMSSAADITTKLESFSNINSVVLYRLNGKAILQYSKSQKSFKVENLPPKEKRVSSIENSELKLYVDALYENRNLGVIEFNFKVYTVFDLLKKDFLSLVLLVFAMLIFSYLLATYFAKKFTNPILKLVSFLEKIYFIDSVKRIETSEDNEFGRLYKEVNTMLDRIEKAHEQLKIASVAFETQSGMVIADKNLNILRVNKAFTKITGYSMGEVLGKTPNILKSGMHGKSFYDNMYDNLNKYNFWMGEINNKHKDGSIVNELLTIYTILDNDGKIMYYVSSFLDMTPQKKAEAQLKEKEHLLVQQSKMAAMGEMLENIAHQWRQPLSIISTTSSALLLRKSMDIPITKEEEEHDLEKIGDTVKYLSQTIDDFRNYFKPNKNKEIFNLKKSYTKSLNLLSRKFDLLGIKLIEDIDDVKTFGYENEFIQVVINLLNNAKDILIEKSTSSRAIFINIYKENDYAVFSVKDNGGGIQQDVINRIFEPYFTTKHNSNGTGIGLYMSKEMIEKHMDGKLEVENTTIVYGDKEYKGASFKISLPYEK